jgi:potassium efflux system protein
MRSTTITNWDRQELIVPNKDLITGRLLNWTLSDNTNRIVIDVGIAYGSDTDRACQLMRQICHEHPNVLRDPEPTVTFEAFGDSSLQLRIRAFLSDLDERLPTMHELNLKIHDTLLHSGIEMAFPQRDLHIRSLPQELTNLLSGNPNRSELQNRAA